LKREYYENAGISARERTDAGIKMAIMKPATPSAKIRQGTSDELHEAIRRRAEEIYIRNGRIVGRDVQNWMQAEQEIMDEAAERRIRRAVAVTVDGVRYVGEYSVEAAEGYTPGAFAPGESVPVRFDGDHMFVTLPNGRELKTVVVKKESLKQGT
jgi:hypothetical protein